MRWLNEFNSTNAKILAGIVMGLGVTVLFCTAVANGWDIPEVALGEMLTFIAAWAGISYLQFAKKRDSFVAPSPDSARSGDVPADSPAPVAPLAPEPPALAGKDD